MFITRLISGILLVIAAIAVFHYGGILLSAVLCILSLIGCYEIYKVTKMEKHPIAVVGYLSTIAYYVLNSFGLEQWLMAEMILFAIVSLIVFVARFPKDEFQTVAIGFFTVIYVSVLLACIYQTRQLNNGQWLVWMILIGSWGSDTCAYATGRLLGKHHFSELSPKKTIEGCVGGVLGAAIIAYIFGCYFPDG
ncbi:MAG: phosphatidate cytidylyltransferase, partial [Eubacterium sp.]|nr:phosphatidate cytidylyltransferase [Eubacterium sp.]